jgi:hypothetical protein
MYVQTMNVIWVAMFKGIYLRGDIVSRVEIAFVNPFRIFLHW